MESKTEQNTKVKELVFKANGKILKMQELKHTGVRYIVTNLEERTCSKLCHGVVDKSSEDIISLYTNAKLEK